MAEMKVGWGAPRIHIFFVLSLERRRVLHFNVTRHPSAEWTAPQGVEACPFDRPGCFLIRDHDKIYGTEFRDRVDGLGGEPIRTTFRSPWQNGSAERWIGSQRRDRLDPVIAINERPLRRVLRSDLDSYHPDRRHLGLEKDTAEERLVEARGNGKVISLSRVGGLHPCYSRYLRELRTAA